VEFVITLAIRGIGINFFQVVFVIRAVFVDTFPDNKELSALYRDEGMSAEGTAQFKSFMETVVLRGKHRTADLTQELAFGAIVVVKVLGRGITARTACIGRDPAFATPADRSEFAAIVSALVFTPEMLPVLLLQRNDPGKLIRFEFLVFWGVDLVMSPLLKRNIFADKIEKPALLTIKIIDD
jgi:hypothetical protein